MKKAGLLKKSKEIAVILLCVLVMSVGISKKEGYHMDELLSFELSNALFNPWIVPTQPQGRLAKFVENEIAGESVSETFGNLVETGKDVLANKGNSKLLSYQADVYEEPVWITAKQFTDYICVDKNDAFQYLSVYFNVKDDNHPPLHFALLHTISSIFQGKAEPFMGCVINLLAAVGVLMLLMKLGKMLAELLHMEEMSGSLGLLAALFYGLSTGALATVLLIRMYGLLTFFSVALFTICLKKWQEKGFEKKNFLLILVTVCGFWTQYFFLFYCITLIAVLVCLLLFEKRWRECLCLVRSMVLAAAAGVLCFPFAIADVLSSGRGVEALQNLSEGFAGYGERLLAFGKILADRTFGGFMILFGIMALMCLIWHLRSRKTSGNTGKKGIWQVLLLTIIPPVGYFLLAARMSPYLVDRYIMPLFPFVCLIGALILCAWMYKIGSYFVKEARQRKYLLAAAGGVVLLFLGYGLISYDGTYLYKGYAEQEALAGAYANLPCICVYEGVGYYENLPEFTRYEKTLLLKPTELSERTDKASIEALDKVMLLVKIGADPEEVCSVMEQTYGFTKKEELFAEDMQADGVQGNWVHRDRIFLFEK